MGDSSQDNPTGVHDEVAMKSPAYKARVKCSTFGSKFSASAQDLRSLDIERERFDEDSPKGLIEACEVTLESEAKSPIQGTRCMPSRPLSRWRKLLKLLKRKSVQRLASITSVQKISSIKMGRSGRDNLPAPFPDANLCKMKASWKIFSFSELQKATNNFSPDNLIGRGGFAEVYKGRLKTGQLVAVKHVSRGTHEEAVTSFLSELGIIVHVDHPNTAKLIGYGVERELHIVLELSSLGSLASILYGSREKLDWNSRYKIALGTADGLLYLHEGCQRRIIHRDIKADNILLTENYEPQVYSATPKS